MNRTRLRQAGWPISLWAGLLAAQALLSAGPPGPPVQRWLTGYVAGYERDLLPLGELNWAAMTDVTVARAAPLADGRLDTGFDIGPLEGPRWASAVVRAAHSHGVRATLMLGGAGTHGAFASAASPARRERFVREVLAEVDRAGFDGLDLDWEPLLPQDEPDLRALARSFRQKRPGLLLSLPLGYVNSNFAAEEARPSLAALVPLFDRINLMTYAMAGDHPVWASWHAAALRGETEATPTSLRSSVEAYLAAGIPAAKLGVGVGFFGQCFQGVGGPRQAAPFRIVASDGDMSYVNIVRDYLKPALRRWDAAAGVPYLGSPARFGPQKCNYVSYDDPRSVALKASYARERGLGEMIVWTVAQGHLRTGPVAARDPLLAAMKSAF